MNCFWESIGSYNTSLWWAQIIWIIASIVMIWLLWHKDTHRNRRILRSFMAVTCFWIGIIYYAIFAQCRDYNELASIVWCFMGIIWLIDAVNPKTCVIKPDKVNRFALLLLFAPIVYPFISLALGRTWPLMTTPLMPFSVAVFMLGLMLAFKDKVNLVLLMLLCQWMLVGIIKARSFGIPEVYILVVFTLPALWTFFAHYIDRKAKKGEPMKPTPLTMKSVLLSVFILVIALCVYTTLYWQP